MKISLAISDLSVRGGTHKQLLRLAQYLVRTGHQVEIVTYEYVPENCYPEFRDFVIKTPFGSGRGSQRHSLNRIVGAWKLAKCISPDSEVLNIHDLGCEWMALAVIMLRKKLPVVWQVNDLHPAFRVGPFRQLRGSWKHYIHRSVSKLVAHHAKSVTVNVTKNADLVTRLYGVKPSVFYCGVDQLNDRLISRQLPRSIQLTSIGVMLRYRNYESILAAMKQLREKGIESQLTIVGSTKYDQAYARELQQVADSSGLKVEIAGEVDEDRLQQILTATHVFVFVNVDQSWGVAVFEAMSMSLPVVLSNSVGAVELLKDSKGVRVVDPRNPRAIADAIHNITSTQSEYDKRAAAAFHDVSTYTWDDMYSSRMRALFGKVVEGHEVDGRPLSLEPCK